MCGHIKTKGEGDSFSDKVTSFLQLQHREKAGKGVVIRSSALPICGRNYSFGMVLPPQERPNESHDFLLEIYSRVGTLTHSIVQRWLGMSGVLYGDWKCFKCGKVKRGKLGPRKCKRCDQEMVYEELTLEHPHLKLSGHPDGILFVDGKYIGFELKTKNQRVVDGMVEPIDAHVAYQTACYSVMLSLTRGIKLKEYAIFYLSRDTPWSYKVGYSPKKGADIVDVYRRGRGDSYLLKIFRFKISTDIVAEEIEYLKKVISAQKEAGNRLLSREKWGVCKKPSDPDARFCMHRHLCWSKMATRLEQPCKGK
jgi:hypothetical protein